MKRIFLKRSNMKKNNNKKILKKSNGFTMIDIIVSMVIIIIFAVFIINLMGDAYVLAIEIQKGANANAYATQIIEKVNEHNFNDLLTNPTGILSEVRVENSYVYTMTVADVPGNTNTSENLKQITVTISYKVGNNDRQLVIRALKVNENNDEL